MSAIPVSAAKTIAKAYDYDQVVIVARKVGVTQHVTTYGVTPEHCEVAARIGEFVIEKVMSEKMLKKERLLKDMADFLKGNTTGCLDEEAVKVLLKRYREVD
jgi:acetylornithine/succinyldiaminopimelate/putrescine aminotransferase